MVKWQDVKKYLIGSSIGIVILFSALFFLTGVDYTYSEDINCGETCESYINITTSYWRICFDNYNGTKYENEILFKKQIRSRTLHVNLDKIDNIISTEPKINVDWMVPTYGNNWRPIKSGDCWERGKVNKIKLIGHKESTQTIKWGFDLGDKVNIDPIWYGDSNIESISRNANLDLIKIGDSYTFIDWLENKYVNYDGFWKVFSNATTLTRNGDRLIFNYNDKDLIIQPLVEYKGNTYTMAQVKQAGGDINYSIVKSEKRWMFDFGIKVPDLAGWEDFRDTIKIKLNVTTPVSLSRFQDSFAFDKIKFIGSDIKNTCTYSYYDTEEIATATNYSDCIEYSTYNYTEEFVNYSNCINETLDEFNETICNEYGTYNVTEELTNYSDCIEYLTYNYTYNLTHTVPNCFKLNLDKVSSNNVMVEITKNWSVYNVGDWIFIDPTFEDTNSTDFNLGTYYQTQTDGQNVSLNNTIDNNTKLLLHADGADGGTTFIDSSNQAHTVTAVANANTSTNQFKFGNASAGFDGTGDYISVPDSADWDLFGSSADATIDFWVKHTDHAGTEMYMAQWESGNDVWYFYHDGTGLNMYALTGGVTIIQLPSAGEITDTNWHHIALVKEGTTYTIYKDGTSVSTVVSATTDTYAAPLRIGTDDTAGNWFDGSIDELRITKGTARWTGNFTVPAQEYPTTGSGFFTTGNFTSQVFDGGELVKWDNIEWNWTNTTASNNITIQTRTSNDNSGWTAWSSNQTSPSGLLNSSARYLQYRAELSTDDTSYTPYLESVNITYLSIDSCSYSSGNWVVDCSDYCNITSNTDIGGNNLSLTGTGIFDIRANITHIDNRFIWGGCVVNTWEDTGGFQYWIILIFSYSLKRRKKWN